MTLGTHPYALPMTAEQRGEGTVFIESSEPAKELTPKSERQTLNLRVTGSNPVGPTGKPKVVSPIPGARDGRQQSRPASVPHQARFQRGCDIVEVGIEEMALHGQRERHASMAEDGVDRLRRSARVNQPGRSGVAQDVDSHRGQSQCRERRMPHALETP